MIEADRPLGGVRVDESARVVMTPGPGCLGETKPMSKTQPTEVKTDGETITGPHLAADAAGKTYEFFRCEACGVETTDGSIRTGCFRCDAEGDRQ